jgi:hypothetical protein
MSKWGHETSRRIPVLAEEEPNCGTDLAETEYSYDRLPCSIRDRTERVDVLDHTMGSHY